MFCLVTVWSELLGPRGRTCAEIGGRAVMCSGGAVPGVGQGSGMPWAPMTDGWLTVPGG